MEDQFIGALKGLGPIGIIISTLAVWYLKYHLPEQNRRELIRESTILKHDMFIEQLVKNGQERIEKITKEFRDDMKELQDKFLIGLQELRKTHEDGLHNIVQLIKE